MNSPIPTPEPTAKICEPDQVPAFSRLLGLPVLDDQDPEGNHHPNCAGCGGSATSETCPYSVARRGYAERFNAREVSS